MNERMTQEYFDWMVRLVCGHRDSRGLSWRKLLGFLHEQEFVPLMEMDENRAVDGIDLRYRFVCECAPRSISAEGFMESAPCSVLEMMVALAVRCEEHIMDDPDIGNRTGLWFWTMIRSLGLYSMDDRHFDEGKTAEIVERFQNRNYEENGRGGLFTVEHYRSDMRHVEIWYQMMWYLNEYLRQSPRKGAREWNV